MTTRHPVHPRHPRSVVGTRWTSCGATQHRHYEAVQLSKRSGLVSLRPPIAPGDVLEIPWRELRDRSQWLPDWR